MLLFRYSDRQLVTDLQSPKESDQNKALGYIYRQYFPVAEKLIFNHYKISDPKDIFQEAVMILYEKVRAGGFDQKSTLKTYLMGIVKNLCKNSWQNKASALFVTSDGQLENSEESVLADGERSEQELTEWRRSVVISCLERMDAKCRKLLSGYYFEGANMKELSDCLGYAGDKVAKSKKCKCMKKLMEMVHAQLKNDRS